MNNNKALYQGLPKEVVAVADRIGVDRSTPEARKEWISHEFLKSHLDAEHQHLSESKSELAHQTYLFEEGDKKSKTIQRDKKNKTARVKNKRLTAKQRKELFTIKSDTHVLNYDTFAEIHKIWQSYIDDLIGSNIKGMANETKLLHADYHGAKLAVVASNNPDLVGISGIVVQETKNTFKLINKDNRLLTIGKDGAVFALFIAGQVSKLNGSNLRMSPFNRSKAKIKSIKPISENL